MFLTDPALRVIAAATGDVWPEHLWRHDTATPGPLGELATLLHQITLRFNDNTELLDRLLLRLEEQASRSLQQLREHGTVTPGRFDGLLTDVRSQLDRRIALFEMLVAAYAAWRKHRPIGLPTRRHLLLRAGDPTFGVATLRHLIDGTWLVLPDSVAAANFAVPYADRIIGEVTACDTGWQPMAYTNPEHRENQPAMTYPLPAHMDLAAACRSLLRWWHLRHSAAWRSRTPAQLSTAELDALST